jgi:mRNA interferase HicA
MKRWLEQQGATFEPGKGSHLKVFLNSRQSTLPILAPRSWAKALKPRSSVNLD